MNPAAPEPLPLDDDDEDDDTGDFYEEDEPYEKILYQMAHGEPFVTAPPPGWTGPVRLPPEGYFEEDDAFEEFLAAIRRGDESTAAPPPPDWQP